MLPIMLRASFEENTFECAYDIELAMGTGGNPQVFSPGQVLKNLLGFDSASARGSAYVIWHLPLLLPIHGVVRLEQSVDHLPAMERIEQLSDPPVDCSRDTILAKANLARGAPAR
jgi:hypothetical protein